MRKASMAAALCLLVTAAVGAQDLSVVYMEGDAQVRNGSAWNDLAIGDAVPADSSVRVSRKGCLELKGAAGDFFLNREGSYALADLIAARQKTTSRGAPNALANSLRYLAKGPQRSQSTAAGVRAENKGKDDTDGWVESSAQVFLEAGKALIRAGRFDQAIVQLNEALDAATDEETPEIQYWLAAATELSGDIRNAWKDLSNVQPGASDTWAGDFVLLKAKLMEDSSDYQAAVDWLTANDLSADAQRAQLYFFLLGLACRGADQEEAAQQALSRAVTLGPETDLGKAATELLK